MSTGKEDVREYRNGLPPRCLLVFVTYHRNAVIAVYGDLMGLLYVRVNTVALIQVRLTVCRII